jgi:hypothetical protein
MSFDNLARTFEADKTKFLNQLQYDIRSYVISTGKQCIAIDEISGFTNGERDEWWTHRTSFDGAYIEVLYKFIREKPYNNHQLDSALTPRILEIIESNFVSLYEHHSKEISEAFLHELRNDKILLNSFVERLTQKIIGKVATHARKKIVDTIASQIQQAASTQTAHAVAQNVSHLTSTAVGTQVAMYTATAVMKVFVTKIGPIVAKFLASAAFRKFITAMAHKLIVGVITSTVVHFLAAQIGAAIGAGAIMWIIIPIVAAILIAQIHNFPEKLGTEVAISIRQHLERNWYEGWGKGWWTKWTPVNFSFSKPTNKNILEQVFNQIFRGEDLLKAVAQDEEVQKAMKN